MVVVQKLHMKSILLLNEYNTLHLYGPICLNAKTLLCFQIFIISFELMILFTKGKKVPTY